MSFIICFVLSLNLSSQFITKDNKELMELSYQGMEYIYRIKPFKAREIFEMVVKKYPEHPFGYFGIAMSKWAELEYLEDQSLPELEKEYHDLTNVAIEKGKKWIEKNPLDASGYMCLGGAYGLLARLYLTQHKWIKAYFVGRKAVYNMKRAIEIDPQLYDAYLGIGLWEYSAGMLGGVVKILARFLIRGNPERGIGYLKICADKGYFNKTAAKLLLTEIFTQTDSKYSNPKLAVKISKELFERYPLLAQMHFVLIVSLYEARMYDEAAKEMKDYLTRIDEGFESYSKKFYPRIYVALGTLYMMRGNYEIAYDYFKKAHDYIQIEGKPTRWAVWGGVRMGHIYDLKGERSKAVDIYKRVMEYPDLWGFREYIEEYIKKPFTLDNYLATQLPPP